MRMLPSSCSVHAADFIPIAFTSQSALDTANSDYSQRFYKLKREAEAVLNKSDNSNGDAEAAGPSTPANKSTNAGSKKSTGKGKKRKADGDEGDETVEASPTKSAKTKKTKSAKKVDTEDDVEVDAGGDVHAGDDEVA